jgi:hypothetical protein
MFKKHSRGRSLDLKSGRGTYVSDLREREKFETEWTRIKTAVVVPALEEVKALLSNAGWQC